MTQPTPPLLTGFAFEVDAVVTHPDGSTDQDRPDQHEEDR